MVENKCKDCGKEIKKAYVRCYDCNNKLIGIPKETPIINKGNEEAFSSGVDYELTRQLEILKGQALNLAGEIISARITALKNIGTEEEQVKAIFKLAKIIFEEAKKEKFLQWR